MNKPEFYRCAFIVRGRAQAMINDLLLAFAFAVKSSTPLPREKFIEEMRRQIQSMVPGGVDDKTADNYRTETLGQIFGMYYYDENEVAQISPRTLQYIETEDQVQFFKNICCKLQAPSGMSKEAKVFVKNGIKIWPVSFLLKVLIIAKDKYNCTSLSKKEINFFVLSNLNALRGIVSPEEVVEQLDVYRQKRIPVPLDGGSNTSQHSNELINLCKYANLVSVTGDMVSLNSSEMSDIQIILNYQVKGNWFDIESYDLEMTNGWETLKLAWTKHYAQLPFSGDNDSFSSKGGRWTQNDTETEEDDFEEIPKVGLAKEPKTVNQVSTKEKINYKYPELVKIKANEIGEVGEQYVFIKEQKRVKSTHLKELNRVKRVGNTKGLGYDVHSVFAGMAKNQSESQKAFFIEVKSEFKPLPPNDTFIANLTANEFKAAAQFTDIFYIYKVFLVGPAEYQKIYVFSLRDPLSKNHEGLKIIPDKDGEIYRIIFSRSHCEEIKYA